MADQRIGERRRGGAALWTTVALWVPFALAGCDDGGEQQPGTGGQPVTGGLPATGGEPGGGAMASGGAVSSGGTVATGGMGATGGSEQSEGYSYSACERPVRVGGFTIEYTTDFTTVTGKVTDGIVPTNIPVLETNDGDCSLVRGRQLFCDPECAVGDTCGEDGTCVPYPVGQNAGEVTITGLKETVIMMPRVPANNYTSTGTLTHPAFAEGDRISLTALGGDVPAFSMQAEGISPLNVHQEELPLQMGEGATITWDAPAQAGRSRVDVELNISLHGGNPVRIECDTDDDGELTVPAALVSELLSNGYSGFPAISIVRQTADSVEVPGGCADLRVISAVNRLPVLIDGLTSCNTSDDCPSGQSCQVDLSCQ